MYLFSQYLSFRTIHRGIPSKRFFGRDDSVPRTGRVGRATIYMICYILYIYSSLDDWPFLQKTQTTKYPWWIGATLEARVMTPVVTSQVKEQIHVSKQSFYIQYFFSYFVSFDFSHAFLVNYTMLQVFQQFVEIQLKEMCWWLTRKRRREWGKPTKMLDNNQAWYFMGYRHDSSRYGCYPLEFSWVSWNFKRRHLFVSLVMLGSFYPLFYFPEWKYHQHSFSRTCFLNLSVLQTQGGLLSFFAVNFLFCSGLSAGFLASFEF